MEKLTDGAHLVETLAFAEEAVYLAELRPVLMSILLPIFDNLLALFS